MASRDRPRDRAPAPPTNDYNYNGNYHRDQIRRGINAGRQELRYTNDRDDRRRSRSPEPYRSPSNARHYRRSPEPYRSPSNARHYRHSPEPYHSSSNARHHRRSPESYRSPPDVRRYAHDSPSRSSGYRDDDRGSRAIHLTINTGHERGTGYDDRPSHNLDSVREDFRRPRSVSRYHSNEPRSATHDQRSSSTVITTNTFRGKWPSTVQVHDQPPPGSWACPTKKEVRRLLDTDPNAVPQLPHDRSTIYHYVCGHVHAPEQCRGPLDRGVLDGCIYCGQKDHITDDCQHFQFVPKNQRELLRHYLYVVARQGLPPVASAISFHKFHVGPNSRSLLPVLPRRIAAFYSKQQQDMDKEADRPPWWETFDYSRIDPSNETSRLPEPCLALGRWSRNGPLPNRKSTTETLFDLEQYGPKEDAPYYNKWWTLFVNDHIPGPLPPSQVTIPDWVTNHQGQARGLLKAHVVRQPSPGSSLPVRPNSDPAVFNSNGATYKRENTELKIEDLASHLPNLQPRDEHKMAIKREPE